MLESESGFDLSGPMWGAQGQTLHDQKQPPPTTEYFSVQKGLTIAYKGHPYNDAFSVVFTEYLGWFP